MEDRAIRGVPWTLVTYGANKLVTVATTIVLARLLVPEEFGLVTLALLTVALFNVLRDLGLGGALVLRQDLDRQALGTVLTLMLAMGVVVAMALAALSPLIADLFGEPRLDGILVALSATVFLSGFNWFYETTMQRELEFRKRFISLSAQTVSYAAVAITLAALGAGVWSLVAGQLAGTIALGVLLFALAPYRIRPGFDRAVARDVLGDSAGFMLQGGLAVVQQNADYIAVGRLLGATPVGYYSIAFRLGELPYQGIADPVAKVTFPGFARMRHRGEDVVSAFLTTLGLVALITCPIGIILSGAADPFTHVVFGDKWLPMIGPLAVLGIWGAVRTVQVTIAWLLNSIGEARLMGVISALVLVPLIPALFLAADLEGITAVAWVMLADMILSLLVLAYAAQRRAGVPLARQWQALRAVALAAPLTWGVTRAIAELSAEAPAAVTLTCSAIAGLAAYLVAVSLFDPGIVRRAVKQVGRTLESEPAQAASGPAPV